MESQTTEALGRPTGEKTIERLVVAKEEYLSETDSKFYKKNCSMMEMHRDGKIINSTNENVINIIDCLHLTVYQKILINLS